MVIGDKDLADRPWPRPNQVNNMWYRRHNKLTSLIMLLHHSVQHMYDTQNLYEKQVVRNELFSQNNC